MEFVCVEDCGLYEPRLILLDENQLRQHLALHHVSFANIYLLRGFALVPVKCVVWSDRIPWVDVYDQYGNRIMTIKREGIDS